MNKLRKIIVACLSVLFAVALVTSCGKKPLNVPSGFSMNEDYELSWKAVPDARSYALSVHTAEGQEVKEEKSNSAKFDFSGYEEGDYVVAVKAVAGSSRRRFSSTFVDTRRLPVDAGRTPPGRPSVPAGPSSGAFPPQFFPCTVQSIAQGFPRVL